MYLVVDRRLAPAESQRIRHTSTARSSPLHHSILVRHPLPQLWRYDRVCPFCPRTMGQCAACQRGFWAARWVMCDRGSLELGECVAQALSRCLRHCGHAGSDSDDVDCRLHSSVGGAIDGLGAVRAFLRSWSLPRGFPRMRCPTCPDSSPDRHRLAPHGAESSLSYCYAVLAVSMLWP